MPNTPKTLKFRPTVRHGAGGPERRLDEMEGEAIDYGLVLHPYIKDCGELCPDLGFVVSCPQTGYRITAGDCRESALRHLDELVRQKGGWGGFLDQLGAARTGILDAREAAANAERIAPVLSATRGVLGLPELQS